MTKHIHTRGIEAAWRQADTNIDGDYILNESKTHAAGYDVYTSNITKDYICDLGDRLEVNKANGDTINIWIDEEPQANEKAKESEEVNMMVKHTLYVGLFDKDTKAQEIDTISAYKIAENLFVKYCGGVTISEARGIYTHDDGKIVIESSFRCEVFGCETEQIHEVASALKTVLNQESVIIERQEVNSMMF